MTVPMALAIGAMASLLATGVAAALGLLIRYTSPLFSGLLFVATVVLTWYLSSHYPEAAREIGGQVVTALQEASQALSHRVRAALQRRHDQVCFLSLISSFKNEFHVSFERFALRFSM